MDEVAIPLSGGVSTAGVVRIGNTVRRPTGPWTSVAHALLRHLEGEGFEGSPRVLGIDAEGREILSYAEGTTIAGGAMEMLDRDEALLRLGRLVGDFHRASATFALPRNAHWTFERDPAGGSVLLHNDLGAWNVVTDGEHLTIIDWDGISPGRVEWEVALSLVSFLHLWPEVEQSDGEIARKLAVFGDGYPLSSHALRLAIELIPDRCRHIGDMIAAGAQRGEIAAVRLRDRGFVPYFSTVARLATDRIPGWLRLLSNHR